VPAKTQRQKRFMMAELGRAKKGKKTKTGMSMSKLKHFSKVKKKKKK